MPTETILCVRCHSTYERELIEDNLHVTEQLEPLCPECEHSFLSWVNCPPPC
jgi:NAD-dependent SIR2 family protein deacetylase